MAVELQDHGGDSEERIFCLRPDQEGTTHLLIWNYTHPTQLRLVKNTKTGKSKGYAFIEYERRDDLKRAYKNSSGPEEFL